MKVNRSLNNIYRFSEKNPEIMAKYLEKSRQISEQYLNGIEGHSKVFESDLESMIESPKIAELFEKIGKLIMRPKFLESLNVFLKQSKETVNNKDLISQLSSFNKIKACLRKAFRQDPVANDMAKDIIKEFKDPTNKEFFDPINKFLKALAPENSETAANYYLDNALLAPKKIRKDYFELMKTNKEISQKPINETYAEMLNNLVKK